MCRVGPVLSTLAEDATAHARLMQIGSQICFFRWGVAPSFPVLSARREWFAGFDPQLKTEWLEDSEEPEKNCFQRKG